MSLGLAVGFIVLGFSWALSSPPGSSPDDNFHLSSIWCALGDRPGICRELGPLPGGLESVEVSSQVALAPACYEFKPQQSAACTALIPDTPTHATANHNGYPGLPYIVLSPLASTNVQRATMTMRAFNVSLTALLLTAALLLTQGTIRRALALTWFVTLVPVSIFFVASTNPTGWAITGVGTFWALLLSYLRSDSLKKLTVTGILMSLAALMAIGSRTDAAAYVVVATVAALALGSLKRQSLLRLRNLLVAAIALCSLAVFAMFSQSTALAGLGASAAGYSPGYVLVNNLLHYFDLLFGTLGQGWGLGWLDTIMPNTVGGICVALAFGSFLLFLPGFWLRKTLVVSFLAFILLIVPLEVLQAGPELVGGAGGVQPRYLLPLLMVFLGFAFLSGAPPTGLGDSREGAPVTLSYSQVGVMVLAASLANSLALNTNMNRYVAGINTCCYGVTPLGTSLRFSNATWWWHSLPLSPLTVWVAGSIAGLVVFGFLGLFVAGLEARNPEREMLRVDGSSGLPSA
jgi:hypothetical protein